MNGRTAKAKREMQKPTGGAGRTVCLASYMLALANKTVAKGPKHVKLRKHKQTAMSSPTWPLTKDQKKQSRPVIVMAPHRAITYSMLNSAPKTKDGIRYLSRNQQKRLAALRYMPKYVLDSIARSL